MNLTDNLKKLFIFTLQKIFGESFFAEIKRGLRKYFTNTAWGFAGRISSMAVSFFVVVYVIRFLGPSQYGLLSYAISFVGMFGILASLGLDSILYRDLVKYPEKRDQILGTAFYLKTSGAVVSIIFTLSASYFLGDDFYTSFIIFLISAPLIFQSFNVISSYFQSLVQAKLPILVIFSTNLFLSFLKIILVILGAGLSYFAFVYLLEGVLLAIGFIFIYRRAKLSLFNWKFDSKLAKDLLKNSWPLAFASVFTIIYTRIDQVLIKHMMDQSAVGVYDVGVRISEIWHFVPAIVVASLFPAIINAKKVSDGLYKTRLSKLYSLMIYSSLIIIIPLFIFSGFIINLLFGSQFTEAANVVRIYAWAGMAVAVGTVVNYYLLNENYVKLSLFFSIIGMSSNVLLNIVFIPIYGISGAALATLISYTLAPVSLVFFKETRPQLLLIARAFIFR